MKTLSTFLLLIFSLSAFAQHASADSCKVYRIRSFEVSTTVPKHKLQDVIAKPDTTYFLSSDQVNRLNDFLNVHTTCKSSTGTNPINGLDIRIVICFKDAAGKSHTLGFDYAGDYQLDGLTYYYDSRLAFCENELKIGIMPHKQIIETQPYKRH
jgi:hypothetical protein